MLKIGDEYFGGSRPTLIVAEIGQSHEGSVGTALALIDSIATSGADAVKFQIHFADEESSSEDRFRVSFSPQDETRLDYWRRIEFTENQWKILFAHARKKGLCIVASIFSNKALELAKMHQVDVIKIASGEFFNQPLIEDVSQIGCPVLVSTGMSSIGECDRLVQKLNSWKMQFAIMQCTSEYPTPLSRVGLNVLDEFSRRYNCAIGLSDHSGTIHPSIYAISQDVAVVEVHVAFSRQQFGPDISSSLNFEELGILAEFNRALEEMRAEPVNKDSVATELETMRGLFTRSVGLRVSMPAGSVLTRESLIARKPGLGIPWEHVDSIFGRRLKKNVEEMSLLKYEDLEDEEHDA